MKQKGTQDIEFLQICTVHAYCGSCKYFFFALFLEIRLDIGHQSRKVYIQIVRSKRKVFFMTFLWPPQTRNFNINTECAHTLHDLIKIQLMIEYIVQLLYLYLPSLCALQSLTILPAQYFS